MQNQSIQAIPGGLWELFIGVWLIAKGFSTSSQLPSEPTISSTNTRRDATPGGQRCAVINNASHTTITTQLSLLLEGTDQ